MRVFVAIFFLIIASIWFSSASSNANKLISNNVYNQILTTGNISKKDIKNYQNIFELLSKGNFDDADELVSELNSDVLMGHVLAYKYLHKDYNTKYNELQDWKKKYADLPQYQQINSYLS